MFTDNDFIRLDWAAKNILRDKADFEIFEGLLTVLFKEKVKITELLESESNKESKDDKYNRVDIKAKNSHDEIILVEIQLDTDAYYLERILFGGSKAITEHISEGQKYENVKKVYSINILYFNLGIGEDYLYHGTNEFVGVNTGDTLFNIFPEYYIIRVEYFEKENPETPLEEWVRYLKTGYIKPDTKAPGLQKARERLRVLSMDDRTRRAYENHLLNVNIEQNVIETAREDGYEKGEEIGRSEGEKEAMLKIVQKMRTDGMDEETIFRITGIKQ